ncbi:type III secretion system stator protein SctL [Vagococcus sp. WN89Y]|uniref:type III secretion system stator protein SctL n=1 Tax=Vagococcus sp. WN89Y TaxID=3457258 RepID=UPI003FCE520A
MWTLKTLRQLNAIAPQGNILRREEIALSTQAVSIIELAHEQAEAIREQARAEAAAEAQTLKREWEADFWQQAQTLLTEWQQQREEDEAQLVILAGNVLNEALQQLLDDVDDARRFHALLKQLLRLYPRQQPATLWCASEQEQAVSGWLAAEPQLCWTLCPDPALAKDSVRLVTGQGELIVNWDTLRQQLLPGREQEEA